MTTIPKNFQSLIDMREASKRLSVAESTMKVWMRDGFITPIKLGAQNRFEWETLAKEVLAINAKKQALKKDLAAKMAKKASKRRLSRRLIAGLL